MARLPVLVLSAAAALAGRAAADDMTHPPGHGAPALPVESGQSAFAAVAEIVAMLQADPATDWSTVDIAALQAHLADMDRVMLYARPAGTAVDGGLSIAVTGDGAVADAIRRMVPAHAAELDAVAGWTATAEATDDGAVLRVTADTDQGAQQIRALGFFGLMATGAHHRAHHWAIATGQSPHVH
ncbi:MAG: hypothetical protein R3F55_10790 [Alphaproteobacteria bacterium]